MIFVTVGAYDLPFDRLVRGAEKLAATEGITEPVFAQIGHSTEPGAGVSFERFLPLDRMNALADEARLIVTQGGPGSIMLALARGKVPIVVPRQQRYGEMVDDHQMLFAQKLAGERKILLVTEIDDLLDAVLDHAQRTADFAISAHAVQQKADAFAARLEDLILDYQAKKTSR